MCILYHMITYYTRKWRAEINYIHALQIYIMDISLISNGK